MDTLPLVLLVVLLLLGLLAIRMPVAFALALSGAVGLVLLRDLDFTTNMLGSIPFTETSTFSLTIIPMFILMGMFAVKARIAEQVYAVAAHAFRRLPGGLGISTVMACAGFAAVSGSSIGTAATMSKLSVGEMRKHGYPVPLATATVAVAGTLGVLIPPSIVLVVYGIYTGQSIGKLFFGNIIPSAIATLLIAGTVFVICRRHPDWGPAAERSSWKKRFQALPEALDILFLFGVIMVALFTGLVTATEAAALSCSLGLAICLARRKLSWQGFLAAVNTTVRISCMVFMIIAGAVIFGRFLALTRLPFEAAGWIGSLAMPREVLLILILLCYIIGGCIMDALAFLLISLPIFYPLVLGMGYDPIWFGQIVTIVTTLGSIMPPIGICCYIVAGMAENISLSEVFRGAFYYVPAYLLTLALLMLFPYATVLALSNLVR